MMCAPERVTYVPEARGPRWLRGWLEQYEGPATFTLGGDGDLAFRASAPWRRVRAPRWRRALYHLWRWWPTGYDDAFDASAYAPVPDWMIVDRGEDDDDHTA